MENVTVIGGAYEDAGSKLLWWGRSGDLSPSLDQGLQPAEAAGWFDEFVQMVTRGDRWRPVHIAGTTDTRLVGDFVFLPTFVRHDSVEGEPLGSADGHERGACGLFVGPPEAEVGDRLDAVGEAEQGAEVGRPVEADPADAEPSARAASQGFWIAQAVL